jgi:uncharacterized protein (UPF0332 family)
MMPESADVLAAADRDLVVARGNLSMSFWEQAARMAYYARFHAAQALIFERTGKVGKTHKGVHREFHRLSQAEPTLPLGIAAELTQSYRHKEIADYDTGRRPLVTPEESTESTAAAEKFVAAVRNALAAAGP